MVVDDEEEAEEEGADNEMTVKLIDFGFGCRILSGVRLRAKVGSFLYNAPEVLAGEECDEKQDMWSLGCVLYVLLSGDMPFYGPDSKSRTLSGSYSMEDDAWSSVSPSAKELVRRLLVKDPEQRLRADQVHH